jgi:GAF domain-containing protein
VSALGEWRDETELSVPLETGKPVKQLGLLRMGKRARDQDYTTHDIRALRDVAAKVAQAIEQDRA